MARLKNSNTGYGWLGQCFHWLIAALIITQYVLGQAAEQAGEHDQTVAQLALLARHKSVGITVLCLALLRLGWRFASPPPPLPEAMARWQVLASKFTHALMYFLIFALPISGWLMSSASNYSVSVFGWFSLPDFVSPDENLKTQFQDIHHTLAPLLFITVVIHVAAALKHHFFDKDNVLRRMMPTSNWVLLVAVAAVAIWLGVQSPTSAQTSAQSSAQMAPSPPAEVSGLMPQAGSSDLPAWEIDYAASFIEFQGDQAGASFKGRWNDFEATVQFDADHLDDGWATVIIDVGSVDTQDSERDETIRGPEFFDLDRFPTVQFTAATFQRSPDDTYLAKGELSIKGVSHPVDFTFSIDESDGRRMLKGRAALDRLQLGIGMGDWLDTTWVGQQVTVAVYLETR